MSEVKEDQLLSGWIRWARVNKIDTEVLTDDEIFEYVCRYLTAAG